MAAQPAATSATAQAEAKQVRDEWLETDLGKLETWDRRHRVDLQAFEDNPDDPGEVWYGEEAHEKTRKPRGPKNTNPRNLGFEPCAEKNKCRRN